MAVPRSPQPPREHNPVPSRWRRERDEARAARDAALARVEELTAELEQLREANDLLRVEAANATPDHDALAADAIEAHEEADRLRNELEQMRGEQDLAERWLSTSGADLDVASNASHDPFEARRAGIAVVLPIYERRLRDQIARELELAGDKCDQDAAAYADERSPLLSAQGNALWDAARRIRNGANADDLAVENGTSR